MLYGIELKNSFGDRLLSSTGLLFPHSSGQLVYSDSYGVARPQGGYAIDHLDKTGNTYTNGFGRIGTTSPTQTVSNLTDGGSWDKNGFNAGNIMQIVTHAYSESYQPTNPDRGPTRADWNRMRHAIPNTSDTNYHYEAFFKLPPSGGLHTFAQVYNPYNFLFDANSKGLHLYVQQTETSGTGTPTQYIVGTTKKPSVGSETHGMQIYDEAGNEIYDTRYVNQALGIKDYIRIPSTDFVDCIQSGTTYNYTLRQPIDPTKAYLGGGSINNFRFGPPVGGGGGFEWEVPTFKMTSSTNLQMYKTTYRYNSSYVYTGVPSYKAYEECLITILEN